MHTKPEQPIRILQIVTNMSYGGLENLLMNYYRNINREKIQFDFLTHVSIHQDFEEEIQGLGGKIYRLPRLNPFNPSYWRELNNFFRSHPEYQVVHCHLDCMAAIPLYAAKTHGIKTRIAHAHSTSQNHNLKYLIKLICKKSIPAVATQLFACSEEAGKWMFSGEPFTVFRNAINAEHFRYNSSLSAEEKAKLQLGSDFIIGHVGQFRTEKNHLYLIDVFSEILKIDNSCRLLLVGKGPQMDAAVEKANNLGIYDRIIFTGARPDIPELMRAMDVFVLPSLYEGLPVTSVEAQASGLPCVISSGVPIECKLTSTVDQLPLSSGTEAWARAILKYKNHCRRDNYDIIVAAGFDINSNAKKLEEFYRDAYDRY